MESRKIQVVGNRSYSMSLPKKWVLDHKLKEQDLVFVEANENGELVIRSSEKIIKENTKTLTLELENIIDISEFLVFCYVKNINKVKILYKKSEPEKIASIKKIMQYLDGYDIVSEDESKIEISFLFNDLNINLSKIVTRLVYLIKLSINSCESSKRVGILENEMNIDRLYNLSKRIIFSCMSNAKLKKENNILFDEDLFFYKDVFKKLEQIGDNVYQLSSFKLTSSDIETAKFMINLLEEVLIRKKGLHEFKEKISPLDIKSKKNEVKSLLAKIQERCLDIFENMVSIEFNKKYFVY